jgi:hypothetical protein
LQQVRGRPAFHIDYKAAPRGASSGEANGRPGDFGLRSCATGPGMTFRRMRETPFYPMPLASLVPQGVRNRGGQVLAERHQS